jgi:hypothetical protein
MVGSYLNNLFIGQFATPVSLSSMCNISIATLFHHIGGVVGWCSHKQMIRINANYVIAFMTNELIFSNGAPEYLKRQSMCQDHSRSSVYV